MSKVLLFFAMTTSLLVSKLYAFNDTVTHPKLTDTAIIASDMDQFLREVIGFSKGIKDTLDMSDSYLSRRPILLWISKGSILEDDPSCRASNHFHNPLKDWSESHMTDQPWYINWACRGGDYPWESIRSAVTWATGFLGPSPDGAEKATGNGWDWKAARERFYIYLTGYDFQGSLFSAGMSGFDGLSETQIRDLHFAQSLQSLGQVLHLLQDMAVPAHVRGDFRSHLDWNGIVAGDWMDPKTWVVERFEDYVKRHEEWIMEALPVDPRNFSVTDFWDRNRYDGNDPWVTVGSTLLGLAEYTNANFVSRNTIFAETYLEDLDGGNDIYYQPFPRMESTNVEEFFLDRMTTETVVAEDGVLEEGYWIRKTGDGENGFRLMRSSCLARELRTLPDPVNFNVYTRAFYIDDEVCKDYAERLLPRAVGYSTALIDYFFRGKLEVRWSGERPVSVIQGMASPFRFSETTVEVRNGSGEAMGPGVLRGAVKYRRSSDEDFSYATSVPVAIEGLGELESVVVTFDFSDRPIPSDALEVQFLVVFLGTLGKESETAVAVGRVPWLPLRIDISIPGCGHYALAEDFEEGLRHVRLRARNVGPAGEELWDGAIALDAQYRTASGEAHALAFSDLRHIPGDEAVELTFDLGSHPIPADATDLYLTVVYRGRVGTASDEVAVGIHDVSEPTPVDLYNDMDRICLYGAWYAAGSPDAVSRVDSNGDGVADLWDVYAHDIRDAYLRFSPLDAPQPATALEHDLHVPWLAAGTAHRAGYVITDEDFAWSVDVMEIAVTDPADSWLASMTPVVYAQEAIVNQTRSGTFEECCDYFQRPVCGSLADTNPACCEKLIPPKGCQVRHESRPTVFRDREFWAVHVFQNPSYPEGSVCEE